MNSHDPKRIIYAPARQFCRAFVYVLQVHENHIVKRAGVAGVRARAGGCSCAKCGAISGALALRFDVAEDEGQKKERLAGCC